MSGPGSTAAPALPGSLALAEGSLFAARRIDDSFAVIDTQGLAGVTVMRENRIVGQTNSAGELLIPDLHGWEQNRISLDPTGLPGDVEVGSLSLVVRPNDHSGTRVRFGVRRGASALISLVDGAGKPLAKGATATLLRTKQRVPVGYDGEVFFKDLVGEEEVSVTTATGVCLAKFSFHPVPGDIPTIGPVPCAAVSP